MSEARIERDAVRVGALAAAGICVPATVIANVLVDDDSSGGLASLFYLAVLVGFAVGGAVAAHRAADTPYSSGAVAALVAFVVLAAVSVAVNLAQGDSINVVSLVFNGLLAYGAGLLGAAVIARRASA